MKVCIIQPKFCTDYERSEEFFLKEIELLEQCDESMDIIVLPEGCDIPCLAKTKEESEKSSEKYNEKIIALARETAKSCNAMVFINARSKEGGKLRNTTYAIDRKGNIAGKYFKQHLVPDEVDALELDSDYTYEFSQPYVLELEGIRFGFLICYDFYFYENFANLARQNLDIIIGCTQQRSDTHEATEIMARFLAYNTNSYVIRASVSMDESSDIGGASMVVAPTGEVLCNMKSTVGTATAEIVPTKKYYKPAGFGKPPAAHYEYIEKGRRPWKYRPSGSAIVKPDDIQSYPRVCAHRGFNSVAPENSLPAFGAAVALGAEEIEFDLWLSKDGEIVSCHDSTLERVSTGEGKIFEKTYEELLEYDFGVKFSEKFRGLKILRFEEILKKFACHTIMNIHIKSLENEFLSESEALQKIVTLIKKYDCEKYVYFMSEDDKIQALMRDEAPQISRCMGAGKAPLEIVDRAIKYGCKKLQFFKPHFSREMIEKAHENGIICNIFWADDAQEAKKYIEMGIDTILTNDYGLISNAIER